MEYRIVRNDELYHHGVKGMKWGVHNARGSQWNANYSEKQRTRDRAVYGRGGVKRINKSLNKGQTISGARSIEADRINTARMKARVAGQVGNTAGKVGGAVAGLVLSKYAKQKKLVTSLCRWQLLLFCLMGQVPLHLNWEDMAVRVLLC